MSRALGQALCEEAEDPIARIGELLSTHSKSSGGTSPPVAVSSPTPTSSATIGSSTPGGELPPSSRSARPAMDQRVKLSLPTDESATDKWNVVGWARAPMPVTSHSSVPPLPHPHRHRSAAAILQVRGTGVHRVVAAAILRGAEHNGSSTDALAFLRCLKDESELAVLFGNGPVADSMTEMLWPEVLKMQAASAATTDEVMTKFAGATELSFGGLDKFFGGLEGAFPPRARSTRPRAHCGCAAAQTRQRALSLSGDDLVTV